MPGPSAPVEEAWRAQRGRELGLHAIHVAILNKRHEDARQLLLNDRRLTGARATDGTTPLMLAALFGLKRAVRLLIKFDADRNLRDSELKTAADHCRVNSFTDRKRRLYSEVSKHVSAANTCSRTEYRWIRASMKYPNRHIHLPQPVIHISKEQEVQLLVLMGKGKQGQVLRSSPRRYGLPENMPIFTHVSKRGCVRIFGCVAEFMQPAGVNFHAPMTIGFLATGEHLQLLKMAASGWSPNDGNDDRVLDAAIWMEAVKAFCTATGFRLHGNRRDNPHGTEKDPHKRRQLKGLWCSSHVEKKLAIYYLVQLMRKHLRDGPELDPGTLFHTDRLQALREANIPQEDRDITILLGNVPCPNCDRFIKTVNGLTGLEIQVQPITGFSDCKLRLAKASEDETDGRRDTERQADAGDDSLSTVDGDAHGGDAEATAHPLPRRTAVGIMSPGPNSSIWQAATPVSLEEYQRLEKYVVRSFNPLGKWDNPRVARDGSAPCCLSFALPPTSTENPTSPRPRNPAYIIPGSDSDPAPQSGSGSQTEGESEPEPRSTPASSRAPLAVTSHSRNAGLQAFSHARAARWQAEASASGRGVSKIGRANSGREIRGTRRPGGQRGTGRGRRTAVGRGLAGNTNGVAELSRANPPNLEQFRYGGADTM